MGYSRVAFNDLYAFDLSTNSWEKIEYANNAPEPRGGHSIFAVTVQGKKYIYVYGGWNSENQFNNTVRFDLDT